MATFVIRILGDDPRSFRGRVQHIRSGEETSFASASELLGFMERMLGADMSRASLGLVDGIGEIGISEEREERDHDERGN